jgi:hypothetical protein
MSNNQYQAINVRLTKDPVVKTIKVKGKEKDLVEIHFVDNAWDEKRFLAKFVVATFGADTRDGKRAAALKKGAPISVGGRLDVRTYEAGEGRKKETRLAFEIQYPSFLEIPLPPRAAQESDADAPEDGTADEPEVATNDDGTEQMPWEKE